LEEREEEREDEWALRASIISNSQLATKIKIVYYCLVGGEMRREKRSGLYAKASSSTCSYALCESEMWVIH
jgi:hypothetical protein